MGHINGKFHLSGLPCSAERLQGLPLLRRDDAPTAMLARLPLSYTAFGRASGGPPRPIMYANHARDAKAACVQRPEAALGGLQKIWARFLAPENLTLQDAVAVVHRPREGSVYRPWGRLRVDTEELHTGPPPNTADLTGTPRPFAPKNLHIKFNSKNAKWLNLDQRGLGTSKLENNRGLS